MLLARRFEDPPSNRNDQSCFFSQRYELARLQHSEVWLIPAQQRFYTYDPPSPEIYLGLVLQHELIALQSVAQVGLEDQPLDGLGFHVGGKTPEVVLAIVL